jgi:hypothetical protein
MTGIHGLQRSADSEVSKAEPELLDVFQVWHALKTQFKRFQEPKQKTAMECDASLVRKDDGSSIISEATTFVADKGHKSTEG